MQWNMAHKKRLLQCDRIIWRKPYQREDREREREWERKINIIRIILVLDIKIIRIQGKNCFRSKHNFFFVVVGSFYVVCYVWAFFVAVDRNRSQSANNITALTLALNDGCFFSSLVHSLLCGIESGKIEHKTWKEILDNVWRKIIVSANTVGVRFQYLSFEVHGIG